LIPIAARQVLIPIKNVEILVDLIPIAARQVLIPIKIR
jgi:hypothetical protein